MKITKFSDENWRWLLGIAALHVLLLVGFFLSQGTPARLMSPTVIGVLIADESTSPSHPVRATPRREKPPQPSRLSAPAATSSTTSQAPAAPSAASSDAGVSQPIGDAKHLNNAKPSYPALSRRMGEQGRVLLSVHILANGSVADVRIQRSSGFARLDQEAVNAVRRWRYIPARRGNEAIPYWYVQPIVFSLNR